jgi:hypothetical protein
MAENFDPYHEWLGIPPGEQPPSHYRLLGIPALETRASVIENAANQRMAHLRTFQTGKHAAASQRLLNEVAAARVCLLKPEKKAAYDRALREQLAANESAADTTATVLDPGLAEIFQMPVTSTSGVNSKRRDTKKPSRKPLALVAGLIVAAVAAAGAAGVWYSLGPDGGMNAGGKETIAAASPAGASAPAPTASRPVQTSQEPPPAASGRPPQVPAAKEATKPRDAGSAEKKSEGPSKAPAAPSLVDPLPTLPDDVEAQAGTANEPPQETPTQGESKPAVQKHPPPSAEEQTRLVREIDEIYKTNSVKDPAVKAELARKLLESGRKDAGKPAEQFVLLRRAGEMARDAGEAELMLEAVDAIAGAGFDIRPVIVKARLLKKMLETAPSGDASRVIVVCGICMKFADEASTSGDVDDALEVLDAVNKSFAEPRRRVQSAYQSLRAAALRARDPTQKDERERKAEEARLETEAIKTAQTDVQERIKTLQQARRDHEALLAAEEKLKTSPDDPAACLAVGRWHCFHQGDWELGLKYLAKGSDSVLKSLATDDLAAKTSTAAARVDRGDAWWDAGEKTDERTKAAMRRRADSWYRQALPDLSQGLLKLKVENRLAEASEKPSTKAKTPAAPGTNPKVVKKPRKRWNEPVHPSGITVISAVFGAEQGSNDVTALVQGLLDNNGEFKVDTVALKGDPTPHVEKKLRLTYRKNGLERTIWVPENKQVSAANL